MKKLLVMVMVGVALVMATACGNDNVPKPTLSDPNGSIEVEEIIYEEIIVEDIQIEETQREVHPVDDEYFDELQYNSLENVYFGEEDGVAMEKVNMSGK